MVEQVIQLTIHTAKEPESLFVTIGDEPLILVEIIEVRDDFVHFKISSAGTKSDLASIFDAISHAFNNGIVLNGPQ